MAANIWSDWILVKLAELESRSLHSAVVGPITRPKPRAANSKITVMFILSVLAILLSRVIILLQVFSRLR